MVVLFLNSCQKDDFNRESKNRDYSFRTITLNQVKNRSSKVSTLLAKTINQAYKSNKMTSAIEIDSSSVIYLERTNGFKSFTYRLKDDLTKNYFNNIVIYEFPDGSTKAFSIKYILNKSLLEATQQNNLKLSITGYETSVYNTQNANNRGSGYSCVSIGYWTTVFKCDGQVYGNQKPWCFNSDGSPATKEVFITIDEDCSYSSGVGDGAESGGIYVGGTPTNFEQGGGDSTSIGGIFIPNPYEFGEEDLNNPDFMFSSQVSQYLNTIPSWNDLIYQANNYGTITTFWMQPFFVDYLKNNGELTTENKVLVKSVIDRFSQIYNNQNAYKMYENSQEKNLINYKLFQTFLTYPTISAQIIQDVFIYRDQNLWSQESVEFTEQLIDYCIVNPQPVYDITNYPGKIDGMPFEWWKNSDYIKNNLKIASLNNTFGQTPNAREVILFAIFPLQALIHIKNSNIAMNTSKELVINGTYERVHNGKADAFRHTFWNAYDTTQIGTFVTKAFTDAHEWNSANHPLETQMDNYNNQIGRDLGSLIGPAATATYVKNEIIIAIYNGQLKYISPLENHDGQNIIEGVSIIKFTNQ